MKERKIMIKEQIIEQYNKLKPIVKDAGYNLELQLKSNLMYIRLNNKNLKHEIKCFKNHNEIRTAFNHPELDEVKKYFSEKGYYKPISYKVSPYYDNLCAIVEYTTIEKFLELAKEVEHINLTLESRRIRKIDFNNYYMNVATTLKHFHTINCPGFFSREKMIDCADPIIALNEPLKENSYREHLIPVCLIIDEANRMFDNNATVEEVAKMIKDNLFVYHITKEQARHLDVDLGLRTTMPSGWKFGQSVFARLDAANIPYNITRKAA
jgi:hypothetical protein